MSLFAELRRRNVFRVGIAWVLISWVALQGADFVLDVIGAPDWVLRVLVLVAAIGLPVALVFPWVFEMTPEGIRRERDIDRTRSITPQTGRKLDRVIIGVLAVAVAYLLVDKLVLQGLVETPETAPAVSQEIAAPAAQGPSVAVLPFVNMSGDVENEYFSDGLTETLLHMLSQLPNLRVAARTSSFAFKGKSIGIGEIARTLGVANVLEGSVQKANDRVRVTAQLVRAEDGFHIWSQSYTRPLEDIFAIQDEIATDVADALGSSLLGTGKPNLNGVSTRDLSAYDSYLKGLEQQAIYSYASLGVAENHFKQALAQDPGFTDARLALARNYLLKFSTGLVGPDEVRALAEPLLRQVRDQQPENPLARALELTMELMIYKPKENSDDVRSRVDELLVLLQLRPAETYTRTTVASTLYWFFGQEQQAIEVLQAGLLIDPLASEVHRNLGRIYADADRLDEARAALKRSLELAPDNPNSYGSMSDLELAADNLPAALDWLRQASQIDRQDHELAAQIARALYRLRLPEEGDYWLARVEALAPGSALARSLKVERAVAREDTEQVISLASAAIADQIEDRLQAYSSTLFEYVNVMLETNRAREGYAFLAGVRPEITDYDHLPPGRQGLVTQWASIALMSGFETLENRKAAWDRFTAQLDAKGLPWKPDPAHGSYTWDYLMNGQVDEAVDHYLQYELNEPLAENLNRHRKGLYAVFAPVYEDPRVATRLAEDAERYAALREQVRDMLHGPEWSM